MESKQVKDLARFSVSAIYVNILNPYFDKLEKEVAFKTTGPENDYEATKQEWQRLTTLNVIRRIRRFIESAEVRASKEMRSHDKGL